MSHSGANYQCKEGSRYVEITVFQVWGVECLMCTKIVFNQNLAMFQQSCQEDSIVPDLRVVQKFVFAAKFVPPTVNRSSCWRNAVAVVGCERLWRQTVQIMVSEDAGASE